ncbi:hypothetical protein [Tabrizicola soli]|uniref:Uncharacterized protein n=1 Tax=Tabrizicola soli TaxID=2185115 RepID=A0ABV7E096_9RHOB|nr:hypothetical protein [Tabrizicola soli]
MQALIWGGAILTLLGVAGLAWCVRRALMARRAGLPDAAMRAELQRIVAINLAALGLSILGLMLVVVGIFFG